MQELQISHRVRRGENRAFPRGLARDTGIPHQIKTGRLILLIKSWTSKYRASILERAWGMFREDNLVLTIFIVVIIGVE